MRRPRRLARARCGGGGGEAPLEVGFAVGVKDDEGVPVIAINGEGEASALVFSVVAAARGGEKGPLEDGIPVGENEALEGAQVIAAPGKGMVSVQGDSVAPTVDKDEEGIKWLKHYSSAQSILVVGDGDFSFSLGLATAFGSGENLVATSLDSYGALTRKYGKADMNITELKRLGTTVLHGVDAKTMKLHSCLKMRRFDRIVFNFPHAGFKGKEDHLHVINAHKQLVHGFFANARHLLRPNGETHVSHKTGHPYDAWDIEQLAYESCLINVRKVDFSKEDYPGYNQKRGDSATCDQPFRLGPCCTFMFCLGDIKKLKKAHGNRVGSISFLGDRKFSPGIWAADMRPIVLHPLAPAWHQPHFPPGNRVHMPTAFYSYPFGVAGMQHPGFPVNYYGTERAPYFQYQGMVQPMFRGPPLNVLPTHCGFHPPPVSRISSTTSFAHQQQPWYQEGPPIQPPWRGGCSYSPQEHQSARVLLNSQATIDHTLRQIVKDCFGGCVFPQAFKGSLAQRNSDLSP